MPVPPTNNRTPIPRSVIGAAASVLADYYYSHSKLDGLFMESGAPGDAPEGNCVVKCQRWLERCNQDIGVEPLEVLGNVLQPFMDREFDTEYAEQWANGQERIRRALARNGLSYQLNGRVTRAGTGPSAHTLADIIGARDLAAVDREFQRALAAVETDPPAGVTAACALLEALFKTYLAEAHLQPPNKQTLMELWRPVRDHLGLDPGSVVGDDQKRILSGLISVVDGVGALRTHAGSAHGRSPGDRPIIAREARLAINAAHAVAVFVLETWQ